MTCGKGFLVSHAIANQTSTGILTSDDLDQIDPNIKSDQLASLGSSSMDAGKAKRTRPIESGDIQTAKIQILFDRAGLSPGAINGKRSTYFDRMLETYRVQNGVDDLGRDPAALEELLKKSGGGAFSIYRLSDQDIAGPFVDSIPSKIQNQGTLAELHFQRVEEAIAERFHMDEDFLIALNAGADFTKPGTRLLVAQIGRPVDLKVARIVADQALKQVTAFDHSGKIIAIYPASIGSAENPSPLGNFTVRNKAGFPAYTLSPENTFEAMTGNRQIVVAPGPNNPVGSAWIGLSKKTYGIHGTPEPSSIGQAESHGCIRLTNWDALELARLVSFGVEVIIN